VRQVAWVLELSGTIPEVECMGARKFTKFIAKYEPVSRFLIDPIAIKC
jgi:hypothetical protein